MSETKYAYWNIIYYRDDYSVIVDAALVDFHYTYAGKLSNTWRRHFLDLTLSEMLNRYGLPVMGYIFEVYIILTFSFKNKSLKKKVFNNFNYFESSKFART